MMVFTQIYLYIYILVVPMIGILFSMQIVFFLKYNEIITDDFN